MTDLSSASRQAPSTATTLLVSTSPPTWWSIEGLQQSVRNANDGISLFRTAEGALGEVETMLQRMRELVRSASAALTADRGAIRLEVGQLQEEIDNISEKTNFNGSSCLRVSRLASTSSMAPNAGERLLNGQMDTNAWSSGFFDEQVIGSESLLSGGGNTISINGINRDSGAADDTVSGWQQACRADGGYLGDR